LTVAHSSALCALVVLLSLCPLPAHAQDRPSEQDLFGAPAAPAPARPQPSPPPGAISEPRLEPSAPGTEARLEDKASQEPLKIGGQLYLRSNVSARQGQPPSQWTLSSPNLVDVYLDGRPNERVRGYLLGRMQWDPTVNPGQDPLTGKATSSAPSVSLDQLWLSFDLARTVFVTAGRQHAKWGTGRFWNPTDWLHPAPRNPLALFDARTGTTMVKLHLPWEKTGWNFYAVALLEGAAQDAAAANADTVGKVSGAARAELVLWGAEVGLDIFARRGSVKGGVDLSMAIWELDVTGELALKTGSDAPLFRLRAGGAPNDTFNGYESFEATGLTPAATLGASWSWRYSDEDTLTLGGEYFFNANGYDDPEIYPLLLLQQSLTGTTTFTPFYLGRHYAGLFALLPNPGQWNTTTFILSVLANLSDRSVVARLDWQQTLLTHLRFEAYGQVHAGDGQGEFRFGLDVPAVGTASPAIHLAPPTFDVGVNLRLGI
jgi:hypothetical protein